MDSTVVIQLVVTSASGCQDTTYDSVVVAPQPLLDFNLPIALCDADSIVLTGTSNINGTSYIWSSTSSSVNIANHSSQTTSVSFPPNQSGFDSLYMITMVGVTPQGCSDTVTKVVSIASKPLADFSIPASSCGPATILPADA